MPARWRMRLATALCITALCGLTLCATLSAADNRPPPATPELASQVQGLFANGYVVGLKGQKAAQANWEAARKLAPNDARPDYAYGLVLLRQSQLKPAIAQFEATVQRPGEQHWPAWQALIWSQLNDRQYDKAIARLLEYASLVRKSDAGASASDRQIVAAGWMGQLYEALDKTTTTRTLRDVLDDSLPRLREALGPELDIAFELGRDLTRERDLEVAHEALQALQEAERKQERKKQDELDKLSSDLKDLQTKKADTAKSVDDWKKWLDEALAKVDKAIADLERDYNELDSKQKALNQSILLTGQSLTAQSVGTGTITTNPLYAMQQQQRYAQLQGQMFGQQMQYNQSVGQMMVTTQQAQSLLQQRAGIIDRYEKATGQLVKRDADLDRWKDRLSDKKQKLDVKAPAKPAPQAQGAKKTPPSLKTYLPLDLEVEKSRVLASYGIKLEGPPIDLKK